MSSKFAFSDPSFIALSCNGRRVTGAQSRQWPCRMEMQPKSSPLQRVDDEKEGLTMKLEKASIVHHEEETSNLQFNKLQQSETELTHQENRVFGDFVARNANLDEEFWTAAWLRAESHWEDRPNERYAENYKRQFADQEYTALKRRCKSHHGQTCTCIVAVKKEDRNVKRTVIKSVVGTLDLSIRSLLQGESFPGEKIKKPSLWNLERKEGNNKYGYVANLCVSKSSRRRGIAINMLIFTIQSAKSKGVEQIFVHVHRYNTIAKELYEKLGFQIVDEASPQLIDEQMYLLSMKI